MCQYGEFELLYNESGLNNLPADQGTLQSFLSLVTGAFQDIIETLWQIAHQNARTSPNGLDYLLYIFMHPASATVIPLMASQIAYAVAHPPTQADLSSMESTMDGWNAAGDDILLTAHSQGNLFAYPVYSDFVNKHGSQYIASYGIAPPSSQIPGQYTLNSDDQVIKLASVADAVLNPGNPPPTPNASQLCTDYATPTSSTNIGADLSCLADHGLNYYLEGQLGARITADIGTLYLQLESYGYPEFSNMGYSYWDVTSADQCDKLSGCYPTTWTNNTYGYPGPTDIDPNFPSPFSNIGSACSALKNYGWSQVQQRFSYTTNITHCFGPGCYVGGWELDLPVVDKYWPTNPIYRAIKESTVYVEGCGVASFTLNDKRTAPTTFNPVSYSTTITSTTYLDPVYAGGSVVKTPDCDPDKTVGVPNS